MRDIETIDAESRILARAWRVARHLSGCTPSTVLIDLLLEEQAVSLATDTTRFAQQRRTRDDTVIKGTGAADS